MLWLAVLGLILAIFVTAGLWWCGAWNPPKRRESADEYVVFQNLPKIMNVAHRGGSRMGPENTLHTFKRAVNEFHADVLEMDLQLSSDGHIVLIHNAYVLPCPLLSLDPGLISSLFRIEAQNRHILTFSAPFCVFLRFSTVDITTDGDGVVGHLSLSRLQTLDAAYWFTEDGGFTYPLRDTGIHIPTFLEVLDEFEDNEKLVYFLDFKSAESVEPAMRIVAERGLQNRVILGSIFPSANRELLLHRPPGAPVVADSITMIKLILLYAVGLMWLYPIQHQVLGGVAIRRTRWVMTERLLRTLRSTGCKVAVFGPEINTEEEIQFYMDVGVQMIVTDCPNVMHRLLEVNKEIEASSR